MTFELAKLGLQETWIAQGHRADPRRSRREAMSRSLKGMSFEKAQRALAPPVREEPQPVAPLDQHKFDHERGGSFCGIATLAMTLAHHGRDVDTSSREALNGLARGIYFPGKGTSGQGMARRLEQTGYPDAAFSTGGRLDQVVAQLEHGGVVPLGVTNISGSVEALPEGSKRYPGLKVGDAHERTYGPAGHWVLVIGYEGSPEEPTAFLVNDPDTGARLRLSPDQLLTSASANAKGGGMWMVGYDNSGLSRSARHR